MKYKILLAGRNNTVIDDFFAQLDENIEPMTTSTRWNDIIAHIKYFAPDVFCYCIRFESAEVLARMVSLKQRLERNNIVFVVVGSEEELSEFEQTNKKTADLVLPSSLKAVGIEAAIIKYIEAARAEEVVKLEEEKKIIEEIEQNTRKLILAVDDSATMLKTLNEQLRDKYDVATAVNGKIALKFLEKKKADLILLDYEMPNEDGPAVLEKLRANEATKDIPVIFLTGTTERTKIAQALVLKPQGYLLKPVERGKLLAAIEKTLGGISDGESEQ